MCGVVGQTVIVVVDLVNTLLEHGDDVVERAEAVGVDRTARMGSRDGNNGVVPIWIIISIL